jgi:hypothetical protein
MILSRRLHNASSAYPAPLCITVRLQLSRVVTIIQIALPVQYVYDNLLPCRRYHNASSSSLLHIVTSTAVVMQ